MSETDYSQLSDSALLEYFEDLANPPPPPGAIRELRERADLTQYQFGERFGLETQTYPRTQVQNRGDRTYEYERTETACQRLGRWERGEAAPNIDGRGVLRDAARAVLGD